MAEGSLEFLERQWWWLLAFLSWLCVWSSELESGLVQQKETTKVKVKSRPVRAPPPWILWSHPPKPLSFCRRRIRNCSLPHPQDLRYAHSGSYRLSYVSLKPNSIVAPTTNLDFLPGPNSLKNKWTVEWIPQTQKRVFYNSSLSESGASRYNLNHGVYPLMIDIMGKFLGTDLNYLFVGLQTFPESHATSFWFSPRTHRFFNNEDS